MKDTPQQPKPEPDVSPRPDNLLAEPTVLRKLGGGSGRTLNRWIRTLGFPPPIRLTAQTKRWRESDVDRWIAERAAAQQPREAYRPAARRRATPAHHLSEAVTA
jgi:predicted DNA-binding transcriptional regulator AlpA